MRFWGFNDDAPVHVSTDAYCKAVGANAGRMPCWWSEPTNSPAQDKAILAICTRQAMPIVHLSGTSPPDPVEYGYKFAQAAARWPGVAIEAWNEPNVPGYGGLTPTQAAAVNDAAAKAAPGRVLASSVAPLTWTDYFAYHDEMFGKMKERAKLRGASIHVYPPYYDPLWQFDRAIARVKKWLTEPQKVWVTEWNLRSDVYDGHSPDAPAQAPTTARVVARLDADPRVACALWHRLAPATDPQTREHEAGTGIWATQNGGVTYALWGAFRAAQASP